MRTPDVPPGVEIVLRPRRPDDAGFLYVVAARWPESWPRVCRDGLPNPHDFERLLGFGAADSRAIEIVVDGSTHFVGLVTLFDHDERAGTVWIDNVGRRDDLNEAVRDEATARLIGEVFAGDRYRKVYARHHGYGASALGSLPCAVHEEVRMVDQVVHDDFLWDEIVTAVYRDDWPAEAVAR